MKIHPSTKLLLALLLSATVAIGADNTKTKSKAATKDTPKSEAKVEGKKGGKGAPVAVDAAKVEEAPNPKLDSKEPAAKFGDKVITVGELEVSFEKAAKARGMSTASIPAEQKLMIQRQMLDQMIEDILVEKASDDVKLTDADISTELARIEKEAGGSEAALKEKLATFGETLEQFKKELPKRVRQRRWVESQVEPLVKAPTEAEVKEFYEKNTQFFEQPAQVRASHILFKLKPDAPEAEVAATSKKANDVLARVKKGEDFTKLAETLSEDPSAKENKGDLNFFSKEGQMVAEFSEEAFKMKKGDVSDMPLRTQYGLHIIKVTDIKEAKKVSLEEAKPKITEHLTNQDKTKAVQKVLAELREKTKVEILLPEPTPPPAASPIPTGAGGPPPVNATPPVEATTPPVSAPAVTDPVASPPAPAEDKK